MRLINADAIEWEEIEHAYGRRNEAVTACECLIDKQPTIQPKQGEWIDINGDNTAWKCNQCNAIACCNDNFCPNCGADMRGGEDK